MGKNKENKVPIKGLGEILPFNDFECETKPI